MGLIFGGKSTEHEISIISAMHVLHFIDRQRYSVVPIYVSKEGKFYTHEALLNISTFRSLEKISDLCKEVILSPGGGSNKAFFLSRDKEFLQIDILLPVFHGLNGEDGTMQGLFEILNVPYTSCPVLASAICNDKVVFKFVMQSIGVPVLEFAWFNKWDWDDNKKDIISTICQGIGFPVVVKPDSSGSSIGISTAKREEELEESVHNALKYGERIVIEPLLTNFREVNCAVIGRRNEIIVSEAEEEIPFEDILTFWDKYHDHRKYNFPTTVSEEIRETICALSKRIYRSIDCKGTVRMDYFYDETSRKVYINEINTIGGALSYDLWEGSGKNFTEVIDSMVDEAMYRYKNKQNLSYSNECDIDIEECLSNDALLL